MGHTKFIAPNGEEWPSVTEVCNIIAKPGLYNFYAKQGIEGAKRILQETGDIGIDFHLGIEARFKGTPEPQSVIKLVDVFFVEFVAPYQAKPITLETKVISMPWRYHGTYDGIVHVTDFPLDDGSLYTGRLLADWKSSNQIYKTHGLQLGGYFGAELGTKSDPPKDGLVVQVNRETLKLKTKVFKDLTKYSIAFNHARALYDFDRGKGEWGS